MTCEPPTFWTTYTQTTAPTTTKTQSAKGESVGSTSGVATTTVLMDYRRPADVGPPRPSSRLQPRQSSPALYQLQTSRKWYETPLPQTQWSEIPSPYRPSGLLESPETPYQQRTSQLHSSAPNTTASAPEDRDARRRKRSLRHLLTRDRDAPPPPPEPIQDISMLYPDMNPYTPNERLSWNSAPDELQPFHTRSLNSQTSAPPHLHLPAPMPSPPLTVPRSPTYPPAGRRRIHSATGVTDEAFEDEAEFRLFVEATAGLGPESIFLPTHRQSDSLHVPLSSSPRRTQSERAPPTRDIVSPLSETPTTRLALHQLAQMPEASPQLHSASFSHSYSHQNPRDRFYAGWDPWLQPGPTTREPETLGFGAVGPLEGFESDEEMRGVDDDNDDDDELPDYAESQAQAQQHQRAEAARRAQELQRRWQLSGGRRGI